MLMMPILTTALAAAVWAWVAAVAVHRALQQWRLLPPRVTSWDRVDGWSLLALLLPNTLLKQEVRFKEP